MRWCSFGSAPMISSFVSTYLAQSRKPLLIYIILFQQMVRFRQDDESFFFRELPDPSIHMYRIIHARSCTVSFDFLCDFLFQLPKDSVLPFLYLLFFCIGFSVYFCYLLSFFISVFCVYSFSTGFRFPCSFSLPISAHSFRY